MEILLHLTKSGACKSTKALSADLGMNYNAVKSCLRELQADGLVREEETRYKTGIYRCFRANQGGKLIRRDARKARKTV